MPGRPASNADIAALLDRVADLLEAQDADRYRVAAYRRAAATIRTHPRPLAEILEAGGTKAVDALPTIGPTMAAHVSEIVHSGRLVLLDRLVGEVSPEQLFATVPGIGHALARRIHESLGVETLEDLEAAAHDGRLETVSGFGARRVRAVREQLSTLLSRASRLRSQRSPFAERRHDASVPRPDVETILDVDADYRREAAAGRLKLLTPRRFNPEHKAWLPILHVERDGWHFSALFSNTARAHELDRTDDWVVVYYERNGDAGQCTVVTETNGPRRGHRVVRGREAEGDDQTS